MVRYDKVYYLIEYNKLFRMVVGRYIEGWYYPHGIKELMLNGTALTYTSYYRLSEINQ